MSAWHKGRDAPQACQPSEVLQNRCYRGGYRCFRSHVTEGRMKRSSVQDYVERMKKRYGMAGRAARGRLLDEFVQVTGYHRKSAHPALEGEGGWLRRGWPNGPASGVRACGDGGLAGGVGGGGPALRKAAGAFHGGVGDQVGSVGGAAPASGCGGGVVRDERLDIDRLLRRYKDRGQRRPWTSATKPGSLLKAAIPIRTFGEWGQPPPGHVEVDLVAHCGESTEGFYVNTLTGVDIATGWVACRGVWGKGQDRVGGAVHEMARALPFALLDLHSDNGGEFINHHLYAYCQRHRITFTRSRPYRKNDNAHVEQKNWTAVRRLSATTVMRVGWPWSACRRCTGLPPSTRTSSSRCASCCTRAATGPGCTAFMTPPRRRISGSWRALCSHRRCGMPCNGGTSPSIPCDSRPNSRPLGGLVGNGGAPPRPPAPGNRDLCGIDGLSVTTTFDALRQAPPLLPVHSPVAKSSAYGGRRCIPHYP